jgi:hypothetical protein
MSYARYLRLDRERDLLHFLARWQVNRSAPTLTRANTALDPSVIVRTSLLLSAPYANFCSLLAVKVFPQSRSGRFSQLLPQHLP